MNKLIGRSPGLDSTNVAVAQKPGCRLRFCLRLSPTAKDSLWWETTQFEEFERGDYDGIAYLDTYFLKRAGADDEGLHFHEMIHVVQWRLLGARQFAAMYADGLEAFGYRNSPLEKMAYDAQGSFARAERFDAEKLVAEKLMAS
jgi:hypothetical protein